MISALLFASLAFPTAGGIPVQIVPESSFPFERQQTVLESGSGDKFGLTLVNDFTTSDKAYEAIEEAAKSIQVIQVSRLEADGRLTSWYPDGRPISGEAMPIDPKFLADVKPGEVGIVWQLPRYKQPTTPTDPANVTISIQGLSRPAVIDPKRYAVWQKIGAPTFKFANIRVNSNVANYIGTISKEIGAETKVGEVTYKVVGIMPEQPDKREHLEILQSGLPNLGNLSLFPVVDFAAVERDLGPVKGRNAQANGRVFKKEGETPNPDELHWNLSANQPVKYWSTINVYRNSGVRGFLSHLAVQPN